MNDTTTVKQRRKPLDYDKSASYREWHRTLPAHCLVMDIDQFEYRRDPSGQLHPVAIIETTAYDGPACKNLLEAVYRRIFEESCQGAFLKTLADRLDIPAYIFLHTEDLDEIWAFNIREPNGEWKSTSKERVANWISNLKYPEA